MSKVIAIDYGDFGTVELKNPLLLITKGFLSDDEIETFVNSASSEDEVQINPEFFKGGMFEVWHEDAVIGGCSVSHEIDNDDMNCCIFVSLKAVIVSPDYRMLGVGGLLAEAVGRNVANEILTLLVKERLSKRPMHNVSITFCADFESREGEAFFNILTNYVQYGINPNKLSGLLKCDCSVDFDAGY